MMYCPQCGTQFSEGQKYCRTCGTNLAIISKAFTLGEAIARSDRGPLPKIKAAIENLKLDQVSADISRELDKITREIESSCQATRPKRPRHQSTPPRQKRENYIASGFAGLFGGIGLAIFLYYMASFVILKIPPEAADRIPFELEPVIRHFWLVGIIPVLSGLGQIIGGFITRPWRQYEPPQASGPPQTPAFAEPPPSTSAGSVIEHTTELLERAEPPRRAARQSE